MCLSENFKKCSVQKVDSHESVKYEKQCVLRSYVFLFPDKFLEPDPCRSVDSEIIILGSGRMRAQNSSESQNVGVIKKPFIAKSSAQRNKLEDPNVYVLGARGKPSTIVYRAGDS